MQRRELLQWAAASASPWGLGGVVRSQSRLSSYPFVYGVASGSPDAGSVVLWTRLAADALLLEHQGTVSVRW